MSDFPWFSIVFWSGLKGLFLVKRWTVFGGSVAIFWYLFEHHLPGGVASSPQTVSAPGCVLIWGMGQNHFPDGLVDEHPCSLARISRTLHCEIGWHPSLWSGFRRVILWFIFPLKESVCTGHLFCMYQYEVGTRSPSPAGRTQLSFPMRCPSSYLVSLSLSDVAPQWHVSNAFKCIYIYIYIYIWLLVL